MSKGRPSLEKGGGPKEGADTTDSDSSSVPNVKAEAEQVTAVSKESSSAKNKVVLYGPFEEEDASFDEDPSPVRGSTSVTHDPSASESTTKHSLENNNTELQEEAHVLRDNQVAATLVAEQIRDPGFIQLPGEVPELPNDITSRKPPDSMEDSIEDMDISNSPLSGGVLEVAETFENQFVGVVEPKYQVPNSSQGLYEVQTMQDIRALGVGMPQEQPREPPVKLENTWGFSDQKQQQRIKIELSKPVGQVKPIVREKNIFDLPEASKGDTTQMQPKKGLLAETLVESRGDTKVSLHSIGQQEVQPVVAFASSETSPDTDASFSRRNNSQMVTALREQWDMYGSALPIEPPSEPFPAAPLPPDDEEWCVPNKASEVAVAPLVTVHPSQEISRASLLTELSFEKGFDKSNLQECHLPASTSFTKEIAKDLPNEKNDGGGCESQGIKEAVLDTASEPSENTDVSANQQIKSSEEQVISDMPKAPSATLENSDSSEDTKETAHRTNTATKRGKERSHSRDKKRSRKARSSSDEKQGSRRSRSRHCRSKSKERKHLLRSGSRSRRRPSRERSHSRDRHKSRKRSRSPSPRRSRSRQRHKSRRSCSKDKEKVSKRRSRSKEKKKSKRSHSKEIKSSRKSKSSKEKPSSKKKGSGKKESSSRKGDKSSGSENSPHKSDDRVGKTSADIPRSKSPEDSGSEVGVECPHEVEMKSLDNTLSSPRSAPYETDVCAEQQHNMEKKADIVPAAEKGRECNEASLPDISDGSVINAKASFEDETKMFPHSEDDGDDKGEHPITSGRGGDIVPQPGFCGGHISAPCSTENDLEKELTLLTDKDKKAAKFASAFQLSSNVQAGTDYPSLAVCPSSREDQVGAGDDHKLRLTERASEDRCLPAESVLSSSQGSVNQSDQVSSAEIGQRSETSSNKSSDMGQQSPREYSPTDRAIGERDNSSQERSPSSSKSKSMSPERRSKSPSSEQSHSLERLRLPVERSKSRSLSLKRRKYSLEKKSLNREKNRCRSIDKKRSLSREKRRSRSREKKRSPSQDKNRSHSSDKARSRSREKKRSRSRDKRSRSREKKRSRSREKRRSRSREKKRSRSRENRSRSREKKRSRSREKRRSRSREKKRSRSREKKRSRSREKRSRSREKKRSRSRDKKRSRSREKKRSKSRERKRSRSRDKKRSHSRDRKRSRSKEKRRSRSRDKKRNGSKERRKSRSRERKKSRSRSRDKRRSRSRGRKRSRSRERRRSISRGRSPRRKTRSRSRDRIRRSLERLRRRSISRRRSPRMKSRSRSRRRTRTPEIRRPRKSRSREREPSVVKVDKAQLLDAARKNMQAMLQRGVVAKGLPVAAAAAVNATVKVVAAAVAAAAADPNSPLAATLAVASTPPSTSAAAMPVTMAEAAHAAASTAASSSSVSSSGVLPEEPKVKKSLVALTELCKNISEEEKREYAGEVEPKTAEEVAQEFQETHHHPFKLKDPPPPIRFNIPVSTYYGDDSNTIRAITYH